MPYFDPEQHARPLSIVGTLCVVGGLYSGADIGWAVALLGVALLLTACYSRRDGFLLFGPFARADAVRSARSRRTHLVRAGIALAAGAVIVFNGDDFLPNYITQRSRTRQSTYVSEQIVGWYAVSIAVLVPFLTVLLVSGAIAEERAAKRWEVLLTTDLRGRELVFGKLLGKLWLVVEPVVVILPVLAMLPLIVGVPVPLMLVFGGAVAVTMLALAGVSAAFSAGATSRGGAAGGVVAFATTYFVASSSLFAAAMYSPKYYPGVLDYPRSAGVASPVIVADLVEFVSAANPVTTYLFAAALPPPIGPAFPSLGGALRQYSAGAIGVFLVGTLLACRRVRTVRDPGRVRGTESRRFRLFGRGKPRVSLQESRAKLRPPVTDEPLAWWANCREGVFRTGPTPWRKVVRAFALMVAGYLSIYAIDIVGLHTVYPLLTQHLRPNVWPLTEILGIVPVFALPGLLVIFAVMTPVIAATQSIALERSGDTLDSLRLTPLTAREMLDQIRAGCLTSNRLAVAIWSVPAAAAVVTGFFPPHVAVALGLLALAVTPPLVNFALYCSAWASTPARAMRNLIFGGFAWHYLLMILAAAVLLGVPGVLGRERDRLLLETQLIEPDEFVLLRVRNRPGLFLPTPVRYALTLAVYAGGLGLYSLAGRWVFNRAVGRFAKSRDATA